MSYAEANKLEKMGLFVQELCKHDYLLFIDPRLKMMTWIDWLFQLPFLVTNGQKN